MFSRLPKVHLFLLATFVMAVVGCATQPHLTSIGRPGFFSGLLHGFIMPFSLIASLFTDVRIYSFPNAGRWYDFGFVIGACMFFGGGGAGSRKRTLRR
jgi:hypothetical protein